MKPRRIAIIGAGPVGGILAAHLCTAGHTILLVDTWKEHIRQIEAHGLKIIGKEEKLVHPTHLYTSVSDLGDPVPEFIFICTKACYLDSVLNSMSHMLKHSSAVFISAQNGLDTEQVIVKNIGAGHVLRAVITFAGFPIGPGEIKETFFIPPSYIGCPCPSSTVNWITTVCVLETCGAVNDGVAVFEFSSVMAGPLVRTH